MHSGVPWHPVRRAGRWLGAESVPRRRTSIAVGGAALVVLAASILTVAFGWGPARNQVLVSTTRRPTPYTELYFADFHALPVVAQPSRSYPFAFVVANHTGRFVDYRVTAQAAAGSRSVVLTEMTIGLDDGARAERTVPFTPAPHNRYVVTISLGNGEAIHWAVIAP